MAYQGYGTVTTDTATSSVQVSGYVTLSAHLDSGSGTWTWQFQGPDGVWRTIYTTGTTAASATGSHMFTVYFGGDVLVRGNATSGSSPQWDWQILSSELNRR